MMECSGDGGNTWLVTETGTTGSITQLLSTGSDVMAATIDGGLLSVDPSGRVTTRQVELGRPITAVVLNGRGTPVNFIALAS